ALVLALGEVGDHEVEADLTSVRGRPGADVVEAEAQAAVGLGGALCRRLVLDQRERKLVTRGRTELLPAVLRVAVDDGLHERIGLDGHGRSQVAARGQSEGERRSRESGQRLRT